MQPHVTFIPSSHSWVTSTSSMQKLVCSSQRLYVCILPPPFLHQIGQWINCSFMNQHRFPLQSFNKLLRVTNQKIIFHFHSKQVPSAARLVFLSGRIMVIIHFLTYIFTKLLVNNLFCILEIQQVLCQMKNRNKTENGVSSTELVLSCSLYQSKPPQ